MERPGAEGQLDHLQRQNNLLPNMMSSNRSVEQSKNPSESFNSSQGAIDSGNLRKQPGLESSRPEDFKLGMPGDKPPKLVGLQGHPSGPHGGMVNMKPRLGGNEEKGMFESEKEDKFDFVNPLLYKPASKPPVIKEGDWLCPDSTV